MTPLAYLSTGVPDLREDWLVGREAHHPSQGAGEDGAPRRFQAREPRERYQVRHGYFYRGASSTGCFIMLSLFLLLLWYGRG